MIHINIENIIHRDLSARNGNMSFIFHINFFLVLLTEEMNAVISDLGFARKVDSSEQGGKTVSLIGPIRYQ